MTSNQMKSDEVGGLWAVYVYWQAANISKLLQSLILGDQVFLHCKKSTLKVEPHFLSPSSVFKDHVLIEFAFLDFTFGCLGPYQPPWEEYDYRLGVDAASQRPLSSVKRRGCTSRTASKTKDMALRCATVWDPPKLVMIGVEATELRLSWPRLECLVCLQEGTVETQCTNMNSKGVESLVPYGWHQFNHDWQAQVFNRCHTMSGD